MALGQRRCKIRLIGKLGFTDHDRDVNIDDDGTKGNVQAVWQHAICFGEMNLLKDSQTGISQQSDGLAIEGVLEVYLL